MRLITTSVKKQQVEPDYFRIYRSELNQTRVVDCQNSEKTNKDSIIGLSELPTWVNGQTQPYSKHTSHKTMSYKTKAH